MSSRKRARQADALSDQIRPLLAGVGPDIQGAVVADLVAIWLSGHRGPGAELLRFDLMCKHIDLVMDLVGMYDGEAEAEANGGVA